MVNVYVRDGPALVLCLHAGPRRPRHQAHQNKHVQKNRKSKPNSTDERVQKGRKSRPNCSQGCWDTKRVEDRVFMVQEVEDEDRSTRRRVAEEHDAHVQ